MISYHQTVKDRRVSSSGIFRMHLVKRIEIIVVVINKVMFEDSTKLQAYW